jgi:membrane associated rhomboid family serine protease
VTEGGAVALQQRRIAPAAPPPEERTRAETAWDRGEHVRNSLLEPTPPVVTTLLLAANVAYFAVGLVLGWMRDIPIIAYLAGSSSVRQIAIDLFQLKLDLGMVATQRVLVHDEWWRLLSYQFVHGNVLHLIINMFCLYSLGPVLEAVWGSRRYVLLYLIAGWAGGCAVVRFAGGVAAAAARAFAGTAHRRLVA